jgi:hypothetical protein
MRIMEMAFGLLNEIDVALNEVDDEPSAEDNGQQNIDDDDPLTLWGLTDQDIGDVIHETETLHIIDICIRCGDVLEACGCY